jgi:anti-sigma regulatory factor (Ser/Thr protein kinase)
MPHENNLKSACKGQLQREFQPEPLSAPAARKFVLEAGWSRDEDQNLRLATVVSEVVTNAILHARTTFCVSVSIDASAIRVDVRDGSQDVPILKFYDATAATGRGLRIIDAMADRWGVSEQPTGKSVWFEMDELGGL